MDDATEPIILVSLDGHAQPPPEMWPEYLETRYHEFLPALHDEHQRFRDLFGGLILDRIYSTVDVFDRDGVFRDGDPARGLYDLDVRLAEMDREGVAGEFVYFGDPRFVSMFFANSNGAYPLEVRAAGVRAWHRWLHDAFGAAPDRVFLVGVVGCGPCTDLEEPLRELAWIADHGFAGTFAPGTTGYPHQPPLSDEYWEPFWTTCEERRIPLVVHAGYGPEQGRFAAQVSVLHDEISAAGAVTEEQLVRRTQEVLTEEFFSTLGTRRPMWQLMLGGVFDRHPDLRLVMTEVRADWLPATLRHLDTVFEEHRRALPAERRPSEYWETNCLTSLSFVHRAEVEMRHEIGIDTLAFGRDYPHPEGTWPNTMEWLRDALVGVPEAEVRKMLGENAVRILGLDRARLAEIAARIGPSLSDITDLPEVDPALLAHFDLRGGYLKPAERDDRLAVVDRMLRDDLARAGVA